MEDQILTIELLKRIFGNLGAVPGDNFGKVGVTLPEFAIHSVKLLQPETNKVDEYKIYTGQAALQTTYQVGLVNIGILNFPEFVLVLCVDDVEPIGLRLIWDANYGNQGSAAQKHGDEWIPINLIYKLNLATAFEMMTQEGVLWQPCKDPEKLVEHMKSLLDT